MVARLEERGHNIIRDEGIAAVYRLENKQPVCANFNELLSEVHDLAGIRIMVDLPHNLEATSSLIGATKAFLAKEDPIEFKANRTVGKLWQHWFGAYECVNHHVTAQFPAHDPLQCYNDVLFEIQVTTVAASLYSKIAHPLHYKNQAGELSRGDEIVVDFTRGLSLCYYLCLYYNDDKLSAGDIEFMRRHASINQGKRSESMLEDSGMMLPGLTELQRKDVKDVPASMLQRTLESLSLRPKETTSPRLWDSPTIDLINIRNKAISKLPFEQLDSREISIKSASEDTCHWILEDPDYKSWQGTDNAGDSSHFLWMKGKAGTGKSTAMEFLVGKKRESAGCDTVLSFFFNARGSQEEKSTMGLYRALLYQLFTSEPDSCANPDKLRRDPGEVVWHFMWVVLVIRILEKVKDSGMGHSLALLRQKLDEIPPDLHALFQEIITADGDISGRLYLTLQWILYAQRPLTPVEFCAAIWISEGNIKEVDTMSRDREDHRRIILYASRGLAEITGTGIPAVQFVHESVKDFLLADGKFIELKLGDNFEGQSHHDLAKACSSRIRSAYGSLLEAPSFSPLVYAKESVFDHADNAQRRGLNQKAFLSNFPLQSWQSNTEYKPSLLYLLAEYGAENLIPLCPGRESHLRSTMKGGRLNYPAFVAIEQKNYRSVFALFGFSTPKNLTIHKLVRNLRQHIRSPASEQSDGSGSTCCVHLFLKYGEYRLVRQILESVQGFWGPSELWNPTNLCASPLVDSERLEHLQEAIERCPQLLYNTVWKKENWLVYALENHFKRLVEIGISHIIRTKDHIAATTAGIASVNTWWGDIDLRRHIIIRLVDAFFTFHGPALLQHAIRCQKNLAMVNFLLHDLSTIDVKWQDDQGKTALHAALHKLDTINEDGVKVIMELLEAGADSTNFYDNDITIAHSATRVIDDTAYLAFMKLILEEVPNVDSNAKYEYGRTILSLAIQRGFYDSIRFLLDQPGVDMCHFSNSCSTILHYAASIPYRAKNRAVIKLILEKKTELDINAKNKNGYTALSLAVRRGFYDSVCLLLNNGAYPDRSELLIHCMKKIKPHILDAGNWRRRDIFGIRDLDVHELVEQMAQLGKCPYADALLKLDEASISSVMLREIILQASKGYTGVMRSVETLRILLNSMKTSTGGPPSRDVLPFEQAKQKGRLDIVGMMETFLREGALPKPFDKQAYFKYGFLWRVYISRTSPDIK
ncbi:hypothetical protein FLAG1_11243 [Fusarium langsethiae]|uniref:RelA/SpoT domain-containing protein n=1 Tax=Fusarium langsethiae TaxID=179993 RepID=A0A0M9EMY6_FUSLA|nr:hypothetical protein FLAG1_11243 [Fusarium langsethiae]